MASGESQTTSIKKCSRIRFGSSGSGNGNQDSRMGGMTLQTGSQGRDSGSRGTGRDGQPKGSGSRTSINLGEQEE